MYRDYTNTHNTKNSQILNINMWMTQNVVMCMDRKSKPQIYWLLWVCAVGGYLYHRCPCSLYKSK